MTKYTIPLTRVDSGIVRAHGWHPDTQILAIERADTPGEYRYSNVPQSVYEAMRNAADIGGYFNTNIRQQPAKYPWWKMPEKNTAGMSYQPEATTATQS